MASSNTPLLNVSLLIDVTFSTPTPGYANNLAATWDRWNDGAILVSNHCRYALSSSKIRKTIL